jgi:preprotein translocase subunit SecD
VVFLRVTNIWQSIKDAWKAEEIRKQIENLSVQNHELQARTRDYDQVVMQNGQLTQERNHFQQESHALLQAKNFAEEALRLAQHQEGNIIAREGAIGEQRNIVVLKNLRLEEENQNLIRQRDAARQALVPLLEGNQQLQAQLAAAQQQVLDLQQVLPSHQEMNAQFAVVADAIGKVPRFGRTGLDGGLDTLLPLLTGQIAQAKGKLNLAKETVQPNSPAAIALQSFERIMAVVEGYLGQVTAAMQLPRNYQDPVDRLLWLQQIQAE